MHTYVKGKWYPGIAGIDDDGHPYSPAVVAGPGFPTYIPLLNEEPDLMLLEDLTSFQQAQLLDWIDRGLRHRARLNTKVTSADLARLASGHLHFKITNNCMKDAMMTYGYKCHNKYDAAYFYCISDRSPSLRALLLEYVEGQSYEDFYQE